MRKTKCICLICVAALCFAGLAQGAEREPEERQWKEITAQGFTAYVMPNDVARELGLPREDIPDDENAATYYLEAANALPERPWDWEDPAQEQFDAALEGPWIPEGNPELYTWFEETAEARRLFKRAASMERCQFALMTARPGDTFLAAVLLPHLESMRTFARLMVIEGHLLEQQGKVKEALETYLIALRMGCHLGRERELISGLVAVACQAIGNDAIRDCLARHDVPKDVLEWLAPVLAELERSVPERGRWIAGERAQSLQIARMSPDELTALDDGEFELGDSECAFMRSRAFRILWPDRTIRRDFERFYDRVEEVAQKDPWETVAELRALPDEEYIAGHVKHWNVLAWAVLPAVDRAQLYYVRAACNHSALRINVALRLYQADHGQYPAGLVQLVPQYLKELPPDPFSGEPFRYRREADGWLLYSVGPDQDDDGAIELERDWEDDGDLVYSSELREEEE